MVDRDSAVDKAIVDRVETIAKEKGVSMAAVATAWCLSKEGVNPVVGLNSKERIDEVVAAIKVRLTEEEVAKLEVSLSYWFVMRQRLTKGKEPYLPKRIVGH